MKKVLLRIIEYIAFLAHWFMILYFGKKYPEFKEWLNDSSTFIFLIKISIIGFLPITIFRYFWNKYIIK